MLFDVRQIPLDLLRFDCGFGGARFEAGGEFLDLFASRTQALTIESPLRHRLPQLAQALFDFLVTRTGDLFLALEGFQPLRRLYALSLDTGYLHTQPLALRFLSD